MIQHIKQCNLTSNFFLEKPQVYVGVDINIELTLQILKRSYS